MASLIAFFSRRDENYVSGTLRNLTVGNTEAAARVIREATDADFFEIAPKTPYAKDYNTCIEQAREDQRKNARPELSALPESMEKYDTVYLGYPNYWGTMPMAVFTFLERFDFSGKTIRPFCTHEGSGLGDSVEDIRSLCPGARVTKGLPIRGGTAQKRKDDIGRWIKEEK